MAERVLSVRLVALVDQYKQAMAASAKSTQSVTDAAGRLQKVGDSISDIGGKLTSRVTLPLVAVGGLATKMAADFDGAFTRMQTLAGVTGDEVDGLKDSVLGLAGETGRAPQELAEALFFLSSSGLDTAQAMDALESSAKASAAGMGSTIQIADAVSSAMNAYTKAGLTAAEATDVLVATARAGKAEPAELAAQMGRVLPIAAELGVTFQDVGASIASLSLAGNDAAASTTQLTNLLSKILKPSQQAAEMLDAVGLSTGRIRDMIAERGLLATLESLRAQLGDSGFTKFLEDQQAVLAGLALTGENVEKNREVFADLADSTGEADKAFATWAESMGAKNSRAFAELQVAMIRFGEALAPVVSDVLGFISGLAEAFSNLEPGQQKAIVGFLALVAAIGPLTSAVGTVIHTIGSVQKIFDSFAAGLTNASAAALNTGTNATSMASGLSAGTMALGALGVGAVLAGIALADYAKTKAEAKRVTDVFVDALKKEQQGLSGVVDETAIAELTAGDLGDALRDSEADLNLFVDAIKNSGAEIERLDDVSGNVEVLGEEIEALADSGSDLGEELMRLAENGNLSKGEMVDLIERLDGLSDRMDDATAKTETQEFAQEQLAEEYGITAEAIEQTTEALKNQIDAMRAQFDPFFGMIDALNSTRDAQVSLAEAEAELTNAHAEHGAESAEVAEAERNLADAQQNARNSTVDLFAASMTLRDAMENQGLSAEAASQQLVNMAIQSGFTEQQAIEMAGALGFAAGEADRLGAADANVEVGVLGWEEALARLGDVDRAARAISQARIHVGVTGYGGGRAMGGPVRANEVYTVGEQGPEFFVPDRDGRILTAAQSYGMAGAGTSGWGAGGMYENHFHFHGPVASSDDARRWVADAFNRAADSGMVNVRGRRL